MGVLVDNVNAYVMGFFLSLSMVNVWENAVTLYDRRTKLDVLQCISAVAQIMNLILHLVLQTATNLDCDHATNAETIFFYILQLGSGYVIIYRATGIITNIQRRNLVRGAMALILAVSVGLNLASDILREMDVIEGSCVPTFHRQLNDASKCVLAVLYFGLLVAFLVPILQNIRRAGNYVDTSPLKNIATIASIKIVFAIIVLVVTVVLSIVGLFGEYFWIQFTIQNYAMIWASTVASRKTPAENITKNGSSPSRSTGHTATNSTRKTLEEGFELV